MSMRNYGDDYYRNNASELTDQLYLAACKGVTSKCLLELGITSIINATLELPTVAYQKQETMQIAVEDRVASKLTPYFDVVADRIHQVHSTGGKILVYCRAGQSRSATLCIAYFMKYHTMTYDQAFQFVRRCRPIIHPNIGFVRQLKEFEKKLASKSNPSGSPTFKKIKSDRNYADECIMDETEFVSHELIPLKPFKPRPRRPLAVIHEPTCCLADHLEAVPILQCSILPAAYEHPRENLVVKIQEPRPVVSSTLPSNTIGQLGELPDTSANGRAKRKTAFTRLTRPNDIAVSFMNIPLLLVEFSNSNRTFFKNQIKTEHCSSVISELHQAYEVSQEIVDECLGNIASQQNKVITYRGLDKKNTAATNKSNVTQNNGKEEKAKIILAPFKEVVTQLEVEILENLISENVSLFPILASATPTKKNIVKGRNLNQLSISPSKRGGVSNITIPKLNSVKKSIGNQSDKPTFGVEKYSENYLQCTLISLPPVLWETAARKVTDALTGSKKTEKFVAVLRGCNSISTVWAVTWQTAQETVSKFNIPIDCYHKLDFSITSLEETSQTALITIQVVLGSATVDCSRKMTICREFPYYSSVYITSALDLFRAEEEAKLNVQWFNVEKLVPESPNPIELVRKISESKISEQKRKISQLQMKWSGERFCTDQFQTVLPLKDGKQPTGCHAQCNNIGRVEETFSLIEAPILLQSVQILGRFYAPHYNPMILQRDCDIQYHTVAVSSNDPDTVLEMVNMYSVPRLFGGLNGPEKASLSIHIPGGLTGSCMMTSLVSVADVRAGDGNDTTEDIPDQIHDINEIKQVLSQGSNSMKCKIWFDVFKRTLMKKRPTFANLSHHFNPLLAPCVIEHVGHLEFNSRILPNSFSHQIATTKLTLGCSAVASIRNIIGIEKYSETSRMPRSKAVCEIFSSTLMASDKYTIVNNVQYFETTKAFLNTDTSCPDKCMVTVSFPCRVYSLSQGPVMGSTSTDMSIGLGEKRTPFSVVSRLKNVADIMLPPLKLGVAFPMPEYQFVQDIEDQADLVIHRTPVVEVAVMTETDSFWFFSLETAATSQRIDCDGVNETTHLPSSNFLLFLPDRDLAGKVGQEELFPEEPNDITETDIIVVSPDAIVAEIKSEIVLEITSETSKSTSSKDKKVKFSQEATNTIVEESPAELKQIKKIKTIYYGRDRSKSKTRLKEVPMGKVDDKKGNRRDRSASRYNEAKVMQNLSNSVNEANSILSRRGMRISEERCMSPKPLTSTRSREPVRDSRLDTKSEERYARRSREEERNKRETERFKRTSITQQNTPGGQEQSAGFTGGLLSLAQNFFTGKSRREQSKDRSRALMRRSKTFT